MTITLNGTTGVVAPEFDGPLDASNLTGALPAIDGSAVTALTANNLTGALPAIDGSALTGISTTPTTAQVLSATAGATAGAVGTYMFAYRNNAADVSFGTTVAGSALYPTGAVRAIVYLNQNYNYRELNYGSTQSGTWRCMGVFDLTAGPGIDKIYGATLWLRIS